jgi:hypothetical protein
MSGSRLDWYNPVHLDTFTHIRIEIECVGRHSHRSFRCPGNIHSFLRSNHKYLAEKMVILAAPGQAQGRRDERDGDRGQRAEDRGDNCELGIADCGFERFDLTLCENK